MKIFALALLLGAALAKDEKDEKVCCLRAPRAACAARTLVRHGSTYITLTARRAY